MTSSARATVRQSRECSLAFSLLLAYGFGAAPLHRNLTETRRPRPSEFTQRPPRRGGRRAACTTHRAARPFRTRSLCRRRRVVLVRPKCAGYVPPRLIRKVLDGEHAGEIPMEQPTRFELVVNLKTAKATGVNIPFTPRTRRRRDRTTKSIWCST